MARLSADDFAAVEGLPVHLAGDPVEGPAEPLGEVEGVSCNDTGYPASHPRGRPVTRFEALFHLRLEAAGRDADRVAEVSCDKREGGALSECRESIVCTGMAMRDAVPAAPAAAGGQSAATTPTGPAPGGDPAPDGEEPDEFLVPVGFTPDYLTEAQRTGLGRIGIGVPLGAPGSTVEAPLTAKQAAAWGAGKWFLNCVGQGGYLGLLVSPACALIGATVGASSAAEPEDIEANGEAIIEALSVFYAHETLRDEVVRVARAETDAEFDVLDAAAVAAPDGYDTVLEIGVEELLLPTRSQGAVTNLPAPLTVRARARVVRQPGGAVLYDRAYGFSTEPRLFAEWGADGGTAIRHELGLGFQDLAERIVDDIMLAYPVMPVFGAASAAAGAGRSYLIEPIAPERHGYDYEGRAWPSAAGTLEPTFRWAPFPSDAVRAADFQGQLERIGDITYDIRVHRIERDRPGARLILERRGVAGTAFALEQPLAPDSLYIWSVRARFQLDGAERTSRWTGEWLGRRAKGFVFFTPR